MPRHATCPQQRNLDMGNFPDDVEAGHDRGYASFVKTYQARPRGW